MRRQGIPLGQVLGIPLDIDYSWFLVFGLITWSLAAGYFPSQYSGWPASVYWITGLVTSLLFFASVVAHELGHAVVARRFKIPVQGITLFVFGGVAQIGEEPPSPGAEFWMAVAGPAVSAALVAAFSALRAGVPATIPLHALATYLAYMNGMLALFNLIPGYPLDGGRILRAAVWEVTHNLRRATQIAAGVGRFIAYAFIAVGVWQVMTGPLFNGLWLAFIGWFLAGAAARAEQHVVTRDILAGHRVRDLMTGAYPILSPDATLDAVVHNYILATGRQDIPVVRGGQLVGLVTLAEITAVPRANWATTPVAAVMSPRDQVRTVAPNDELAEAFEAMNRERRPVVPVVETHTFVGVISRSRIVALLRTQEAVAS